MDTLQDLPYFYYFTGLENTIGARVGDRRQVGGVVAFFSPTILPIREEDCSPRRYRERMLPIVWASIMWWTGPNSMGFFRGRPARAPAFIMLLMLPSIPNFRPIS